MRLLLMGLMACLLLRSQTAMVAASDACRLFVGSVMPGLFPYMTLSLMLISRFSGNIPAGVMLLLGWGGGSPTGARLLPMMQSGRRTKVRLAVSCATMSPMFFLGTVSGWLHSPTAGAVLLGSNLVGGYLTGWLAGVLTKDAPACAPRPEQPTKPLSFGGAIDQAARTMLLVCGTMVMLRVFAQMAASVLMGQLILPVVTALEVTTGVVSIAALPWPLPMRTAVIAGATGFGGMAVLLQNRSQYPEGFLSQGAQVGWQMVHGGASFLIALGVMTLLS